MQWVNTERDPRLQREKCVSAPRCGGIPARRPAHVSLAKRVRSAILPALMSIFIGFLMVLTVIVCLLLVLIVLMQRPRQEGLGAAFGSGMMDSLAGAQTTNVLQKGTAWLGGTMFLLTFLLAVLMAHNTPTQMGSFVDPTDKPISTTPAASESTTPPSLSPASSSVVPAPISPSATPADTSAAPAAVKPADAPATPAVTTPENKPAEPATPAPTTPAPAAPAPPAADNKPAEPTSPAPAAPVTPAPAAPAPPAADSAPAPILPLPTAPPAPPAPVAPEPTPAPGSN